MKMKMGCRFIILLFLCLNVSLYGQKQYLDSLKKNYKSANNDTTKCNLLFLIIEKEAESGENLWPIYNNELKDIVERNLKTNDSTKSLHNFYLKYYAYFLNNDGVLEGQKGNTAKCIELYIKCLRIQRSIFDYDGITASLNNLGAIYNELGNNHKALEYYLQGNLTLNNYKEKISDASYQLYKSVLCNNIGTIYYKLNEYDKGLKYYNESIKVNEKNTNKKNLSVALSGISSVYLKQDLYNESLIFANRALNIANENQDKQSLYFALNSVGLVYFYKKDYDQALKYTLQSMKVCENLNFPPYIYETSKQLYTIYEAKGDYKNALQNFKTYILIRDSISNQGSRKAALLAQFQFKYDKKNIEDSLKYFTATTIKNLELDKQKVEISASKKQRYLLFAVLILTLFFAGFIYNRFKLSQSQKLIIEKSNNQINESIQYAKEIQNKFLKSPSKFWNYKFDSFLIYKPKDIVSGDFYWCKEIDNLFFIVVGDCTGHGVPGAIISVLAIQTFEKTIQQIKNPENLHVLNDYIKTEFDVYYSKNEMVYIGLEYSVICIDNSTSKLYISGSGSSVILKTLDNSLLTEKFSTVNIGGEDYKNSESKTVIYETHKIKSIFQFTDGIIDQKGGENNKKFGTKNLQNLILNLNTDKPTEAHENINSKLNDWIGTKNQIDDITLLGIQINHNSNNI